MIRQYGAQRHRYEDLAGRKRPVGIIPVGTIVRLQTCSNPLRIPLPPEDTIVVEAWLPRLVTYPDRYVARGGHLAQVRSLRNGRRYQLSDVWLRDLSDY